MLFKDLWPCSLIHYFPALSEAFSISNREEHHVLHVHNGHDKNRDKIKPHTWHEMKKYLKWGLLKCQNLLFGQSCGVQMFLPGVEGCCELSPCTSSAWFVSQPGPQDLGSAPVGCWASSQGLCAFKGWSAQSRRNGAELKSKNPHPNLLLGCCQAPMFKWILFYFCFRAPHLGICQKSDLSY